MDSSSGIHPRAFAAYWEKTLDYDLENDFLIKWFLPMIFL